MSGFIDQNNAFKSIRIADAAGSDHALDPAPLLSCFHPPKFFRTRVSQMTSSLVLIAEAGFESDCVLSAGSR